MPRLYISDHIDKKYFDISEVSKMVGVAASCIRYWEEQFKIRPGRDSKNKRRYTQKMIAQIKFVKELLHGQGYTIKGARKIIQDLKQQQNGNSNTKFISGMGYLRKIS